MAVRTHELFDVLGSRQRLAILGWMLDNGPAPQAHLGQAPIATAISQPALTQQVAKLRDHGLLLKEEGHRGRLLVPMPVSTRRLIREAEAFHAAWFAASTSADFEAQLKALRKVDMASVARRTG